MQSQEALTNEMNAVAMEAQMLGLDRNDRADGAKKDGGTGEQPAKRPGGPSRSTTLSSIPRPTVETATSKAESFQRRMGRYLGTVRHSVNLLQRRDVTMS